MTPAEADALGLAIMDALDRMPGYRNRLKAIHINPHLHGGHLTVRVFCTTHTAADPEPYIRTVEDLRRARPR